MSWPWSWSWWKRRRGMERMAEQVASDCQETVWDRSAGPSGALPLAQAHGYIRARATAVVRREVDRIVADGEYRGDRRQLVDLATALVVREALTRRIKASNRPDQPMSRAA